MRKLLLSLGLLITGSSIVVAQAPKKSTPAGSDQPKFMAIWESANYPKDINLLDVKFVSAEEGWAVGDKNTILHTKDGAKTWEAQLGGDPESTDRMLRRSSSWTQNTAGPAAQPKS